jgi:AcrR family transcriptional regulator
MARVALAAADIAAFRARLVAAATTLFARHGFDAVTMRAVAAELGVSAMTPYRYVAGKDQLVALVRADGFRRFAERLEASAVGAGDARARLARQKRAYIEFALSHRDAYRIMFELQGPDDDQRWPELAQASRRAFASLLDAVTAALDQRLLAGDALDIAHVLWASTHGLVALHLSGRLSLRMLRHLARIDHELAGFAAPQPSRTRSRP